MYLVHVAGTSWHLHLVQMGQVCCDMLTFQFFIVFVVHMSVRVAALAQEAALMIVCHMLPQLILSIEPLVTKSAERDGRQRLSVNH